MRPVWSWKDRIVQQNSGNRMNTQINPTFGKRPEVYGLLEGFEQTISGGCA